MKEENKIQECVPAPKTEDVYLQVYGTYDAKEILKKVRDRIVIDSLERNGGVAKAAMKETGLRYAIYTQVIKEYSIDINALRKPNQEILKLERQKRRYQKIKNQKQHERILSEKV